MNQTVKRNIHIESELVHERLRAIRETRLRIDQRTFAARIGISQPVLSKWERGEYRPPPLALMKIGDLSVVDRHWWYEQAGPKFAERLSAEEESAAPQLQKEKKATDPELLAQVLEALNAAINRSRSILPTLKYAEIAASVYDEWLKPGKRDDKILNRLVNEAITPSNMKGKTR